MPRHTPAPDRVPQLGQIFTDTDNSIKIPLYTRLKFIFNAEEFSISPF